MWFVQNSICCSRCTGSWALGRSRMRPVVADQLRACCCCMHSCVRLTEPWSCLTDCDFSLAAVASRSRSKRSILLSVMLVGSLLSRTKTLGRRLHRCSLYRLADIGSSSQASCLRVAGFEARARAHVCWFDSRPCGRLVVEEARGGARAALLLILTPTCVSMSLAPNQCLPCYPSDCEFACARLAPTPPRSRLTKVIFACVLLAGCFLARINLRTQLTLYRLPHVTSHMCDAMWCAMPWYTVYVACLEMPLCVEISLNDVIS